MQSSSQKFQKYDDNAPVAEPCVTQPKKTFHLVVKTLTGKKIEILTDLHDTIKTVKTIIEEQEKIRPNLQKLLFGGRKLDDNKMLHNYNIKTGDWIYLVIRNKEDEDSDDDENEEEEETEAEAETEADKKEENKSMDEKGGGKLIEIEHENKIVFTINIEKGDTIKDIKKKVQAKADIVNPRFIYGGKRMNEDEKTVEDYKFFPENKIMVQGELKLKVAHEFMLNIIYQQTVRQQQVTSSTLVKEIRHIASELLRDPFILLSDGKVLSDDNASLGSYGIEKTVDIIVISESNGGNALKFMLLLEGGAPLNNPSELKDSLSFLDDQQGLNEIFAQELENIKAMPNSKSYRVEELLAVRLWTSNILSKELNDCLAGNKDLGPWRIYLKNLVNGLRHMNFFRGKVYKGVKGHQNLENYQKGTKVSWKTMTGLTKNRQSAKDAAGNNGTIFEIDAVSARDISKYSLSPLEGLALLPFSCFEVMDVVTASDQPVVIKLRELPVVRGSRLLVWADDNPEYNYYHAQPLEEKGISVVFCTSTKDAVELFESQRWLLSLDSSKFRIVSDMVRDENGKPNYIAGIELLKILVDKFKCQVSAMIFCNNLQKAKESAEKENLKGEKYQIVNQDDELEKFLNFS